MSNWVIRFSLGLTLCVVLAFVLVWRVSKAPDFQFFGELFNRITTSEKVVALTFDDGPGVNNTRKVLDVLNKYKVHATFFLIGRNIEKNPELAKLVLSRGHQLGNHSYSHQRMLFQSMEFCRSEIGKTDALIRSVGFQGEIFFRPPFGKKLFSLPLVLSRMGKKSITWDSESQDTETQDPAILERNVLSKAGPGSIVLFHDGGPPKPGTLIALENVIVALQKQGYRFARIDEILSLRSN